jgi:hypothetical protein
MMPFRSLNVNRRFGVTRCVHFRYSSVGQAFSCVGFLLLSLRGLHFDPEVGDMFLRNSGYKEPETYKILYILDEHLCARSNILLPSNVIYLKKT